MRVKVKKGLVVLLALCMLLTMLPVVSMSAAGSDLSITTNWKNKTVQITGTLEDLAGKSASLFILEPSFNGNPETILQNMNLVKAAEQINVPADGKISLSYTLTTTTYEGEYYLFINGASNAARFSFANSTDIASYVVKAGEQVTIPILAEDCDNVAAIGGYINYDANLLTLDSIDNSEECMAFFSGSPNSFTAVQNTGVTLEGDVIIAYVTFTAKVDLVDDVSTFVTFDLEQVVAAGNPDDFADVDPSLNPVKIDILAVVIPGDVNGDGVVDLRDAVLLLQVLSQTTDRTLTAKQLRAAEVTGDGIVNTADVIVIMQMSL